MKKTVEPLRKILTKTASVTCFKNRTLAPNKLIKFDYIKKLAIETLALHNMISEKNAICSLMYCTPKLRL